MASGSSGGGGAGGSGHPTATGGEPPRPPHLIRPDEVDAWLADSANKRVTYHRTTHESAEAILRDGVDITRSWIGSFGQGFYSATIGEPFDGPAELPVAIRLQRPFIGHFNEVESYMELLTRRLGRGDARLTPAVAAAIRWHLLALQYDGIVVADAGGDGVDFVIALEAASVKVVRS